MPDPRETKNTMATRLVDRLREAIVSGAMAPGSKINLDRARAAFGVSLSPLREALARLIGDGLVEFRDNRGYWVAAVGPGDLDEVLRLRDEFDLRALEFAIAMGDVNWESDVMRTLHTLNRTAHDGAAAAIWEAAHREFHMTLISGCGMPTLLSFCRGLLDRSDRYRRIFLREGEGGQTEIAQAAVARDTAKARALLAAQIRQVGEAVAPCLARPSASAVAAARETERAIP